MCVIFKYELGRGTNAVKTERNIKVAFGEDAANKHTIRRPFVKFCFGDFGFENEPYGYPETKANNKLRARVEVDSLQTTLELAARFYIMTPTILDHLKRTGNVGKAG